jgi:acyl-coenzyme A synthetase/AMP-(fatty) acid ligase
MLLLAAKALQDILFAVRPCCPAAVSVIVPQQRCTAVASPCCRHLCSHTIQQCMSDITSSWVTVAATGSRQHTQRDTA